MKDMSGLLQLDSICKGQRMQSSSRTQHTGDTVIPVFAHTRRAICHESAKARNASFLTET